MYKVVTYKISMKGSNREGNKRVETNADKLTIERAREIAQHINTHYARTPLNDSEQYFAVVRGTA